MKWEEKVYYYSDRTGDEKDSLEDFCEKSDYKYFVNFLAGRRYVFHKELDDFKSFAVSKN